MKRPAQNKIGDQESSVGTQSCSVVRQIQWANALSAVASPYLSATHRDQWADGCVLAALGAQALRLDSPFRSAFTQGVRSVVDALTQPLPGDSIEKKRERAPTIYASMVGAIVLARAVDDADLSEEVLKSVLASIAPPNSP